MTETEIKTIRKYINGEKLLYTQLIKIYNKYKKEDIKFDPYIDYLNMYMSDELPDYKTYVKIKNKIK